MGGSVRFHYVAFTREGQRTEGWVNAETEAQAEALLWEQGLTIAQLTRQRQHKTHLYTLMPTLFGVKRQDLIVFSRQLATLLDSGIGILPALRLLSEQSGKAALRDTLQDVIQQLQQGKAFSAALAEHPLVFPDLYVRTIMVGERTGNLQAVLRQLATYMEREEKLMRKLRDAMAYPSLVLMVAVFVVVIILTVALPPMAALFQTFDAELPWPTRALIAISRFVEQYGLYVVFLLLLLTALTAWLGSLPGGRRVRDWVWLHLPLIGEVVREGQWVRFCHTVASLTHAGLTLPETMELVLQTTSNLVVRDALERVRQALLSGKGLAAPMARERLFPSLLAQMVRVGEETGTLEGNLLTLAEFYEERVDRNIRTLTGLLEPALTLFVGGIVAFIALAMVSPMYNILGQIR